MTHRERVLRALNHQEPDRVPLDLGGSRSSSLVVEAHERLSRYLGSPEPPRIFSKWLNIAHPSEAMLQRFDIDTRSLSQGDPDNWQDIIFSDGSYQDEWGVVRSRPQGSLYYDLTKSPLAGDVDVADLKKLRWPDPHDPGRCRPLAEAAARLHRGTDYAVVLSLPGGIVHQAQFLRGFEGWFSDVITNPTFFEALMERLADLWIEMAKDELDAVGNNVDICFWGAIDTQRVLPFGTPDDVKAEAERRIDDLGPGGGYVLCAVHNIQADVSPENVCAMHDTAREYGRY
jgi:uroporphyrinogen decarboxylase